MEFNKPILIDQDNLHDFLEECTKLRDNDYYEKQQVRNQQKRYFAEKAARQKQVVALKDAYKSEPYYKYWSSEYTDEFIWLMDHYLLEKEAYDGYNINCKARGIEPKQKFYNTDWTDFVNNIAKLYNYEPITHYIKYNSRHYAVWDQDPIYLTADYLSFTKTGKLCKRTIDKPKHIKTVIATYTRLFYLMTKVKDYQYLYWLVMHFMLQTITLDNFDISPYDVFKEMIHTLDKTMSKNKPKPLKSGKWRHKKLYLEPGFEEIGYKNYYEDKTADVERKILDYIKAHKDEQVIDVKSILMQIGYYEVVTESHIELEEVELPDKISVNKLKKVDKAFVKFKSERKARELFNKVVKENGLDIKLKRKNQSRSEWHRLVEEGKSFDEVIKVYPDVKEGAFKKYKTRLNKSK